MSRYRATRLARPGRDFDDDVTYALIDLGTPVCVPMVAVMHFIWPHDNPDKIVETCRNEAASLLWLPSSAVAVSVRSSYPH